MTLTDLDAVRAAVAAGHRILRVDYDTRRRSSHDGATYNHAPQVLRWILTPDAVR